MKKYLRLTATAAVAVILCACGGGGGGGGGGTGGSPDGALSENQRLFEELTLSSNGGSYFLFVGAAVPHSSTLLPYITATTLSKTELPASPAGIPDGVDVVYTPASAVIASLPIPANNDENNENYGNVFLENGQVVFSAVKSPSRITYVGADILIEGRTASGQVVLRTLVKSHEKVTLTGTMANAPQEFRTLFGYDANHIDPSATFAAGSAYYKLGRYRYGDHVFISDADQNINTDVKSATPVAMGTIEQYAAAQPAALTLSSGTIKTLKGARCWVQNTTNPNSTSFPVYCEVGVALYRGTLSVDGTQSVTSYPVGPVYPYFSNLPTTVRLNQAAATSIRKIFR